MNMINNPQRMALAETETADQKTIIDMTAPAVLWPQIVVVALVLLLALVIDVALNRQLYTPHLGVDPLGRSNGNDLMVLAASCLTAAAFLAAGGAWAAGWKWITYGIGACIAVTIGILVAPQALGFVQEVAAMIGLDRSVYGDGFLSWLLWGALAAGNFLLALVGVVAFATLFCMAGVCACVAENKLADLLGQLRIRARIKQDIARRELCRLYPQTLAAIARITATTPEARDMAALQAVNTAFAIASRPPTPPRSGRRAAVGLALLLAATVAAPAMAQDDDSIIAKAPAFLLLLGNERNSAARVPAFTDLIMREVESEMRRLPLGAMVYVSTVGSPDEVPEMFSTRILTRMTRDGMPLTVAISRVRTIVRDFAMRPRPVSPRSSLVRGFYDAAQHLNPNASGNSIIFLSTGQESEATDCTRVETCHLPPPGFTLKDTRLLGLGFGMGTGAATTQGIFAEWRKYFAAAGMRVRLTQTF